MSVGCVEESFSGESLSDRLTDALYWTGISIAKITGVFFAIFAVIPLKPGNLLQPLMGNAIGIVCFLGACRGIKEIFFSCVPRNIENRSKPVNHIKRIDIGSEN